MLLSAVSVLVVAQSSSEIPEGLRNNPVCAADDGWCHHPKHAVQFAAINKLYIVASSWTIINIELRCTDL